MTLPQRNAALMVEIGPEACHALMNADDWCELVTRLADNADRAERAGWVPQGETTAAGWAWRIRSVQPS